MQIQDKNITPTIDKFHELEAQKLFDAMLSVTNLRMQLGTFFGTANLAALSVAFSTQKAGVVIFAGVLLWIFMYLDRVGRSFLVGFYLRGLELQKLYAPHETDTFLSLLFLENHARPIKEIAAVQSREERLEMVAKLSWIRQSKSGFKLPLIASIAEIVVGLLFRVYYHWPLF